MGRKPSPVPGVLRTATLPGQDGEALREVDELDEGLDVYAAGLNLVAGVRLQCHDPLELAHQFLLEGKCGLLRQDIDPTRGPGLVGGGDSELEEIGRAHV